MYASIVRRRSFALALALVGCRVPSPAQPASPAQPLSTLQLSAPVVRHADGTSAPRLELMVSPGSAEWRALVGTSRAPLRWANERAGRSPAIAIEGRVLFVAPDGGFALADARTGALRWRDEPAGQIRWHALAANSHAAVALGRDDAGTWLRAIDLATGASTDRRSSADISRVFAVGDALAAGDGCDFVLLGRDGAALATNRGRRLDPDGPCLEPAVLAATDGASATVVRFVDAQPRIDRIDRRDGRALETTPVPAGASVVSEPITGLVFLTTPAGDVLALRPGPGLRIERRWSVGAARTLELRGVELTVGAPLLLVRDGPRWTAVDPITLADRWTRTIDSTVALVGERTRSSAEAHAWTSVGELHWLDPHDGATVARRRFPGASEASLHGERMLLKGSPGVLATDLRSGEIRWAAPGRVAGHPSDDALVVSGRNGPSSLIDIQTGRHLTVSYPVELVTRIHGDDGALWVVAGADILAAYAADPATTSPLPADPIAAFASPCQPGLDSLEKIQSHRCHPDSVDRLAFADGDARLPATAKPLLERIASQWRREALESPFDPPPSPQLLVTGERAADESPQLAGLRAAALRDALLERGVPCSAIAAAASPDPGRREAELLLLGRAACIL